MRPNRCSIGHAHGVPSASASRTHCKHYVMLCVPIESPLNQSSRSMIVANQVRFTLAFSPRDDQSADTQHGAPLPYYLVVLLLRLDVMDSASSKIRIVQDRCCVVRCINSRNTSIEDWFWPKSTAQISTSNYSCSCSVAAMIACHRPVARRLLYQRVLR